VALLDALQAITSFDPPDALPACDLAELADVLDAHGLAALASYQLESRRIGASVPEWFRERLLPLYQGAVNDNVFRMVTLKGALRTVDVPVVALDGAAYVDWIYPHLAFRPIGELRLAVSAQDGGRFAARLAEAGFGHVTTGEGGHTAAFGDGRIEIRIQEGLVTGRGPAEGAVEAGEAYPALGPTVRRPTPHDALLATVADIADLGLHAPLLLYVDVRELLSLPAFDEPGLVRLRARAGEVRLARALHGVCALVERFFPVVSARARAAAPELGFPERAAVHAIVQNAADPTRLRLPRGAQAAARAVVMP
jgi:hypothetical protein